MKSLSLAGLASAVVLTACNKGSVRFSYAQNPASYCAGSEIIPNKPTATGAVASYAVNPALPPGLTWNQADGSISGTPAAASPTANYAVSALGPNGKVLATQTLNIAVGGTISFASPIVFHQDSVASAAPAASGAVFTGCSIHPSLPAGLTLDSATCAISGTPTEASPAMNYKVSAAGACMADSIIVNIAVVQTKAVTELRASRLNRANRPERKRSRFGDAKRSRF